MDWAFKTIILAFFDRVCDCGKKKVLQLMDRKQLLGCECFFRVLGIQPTSLTPFPLRREGFEGLKERACFCPHVVREG